MDISLIGFLNYGKSGIPISRVGRHEQWIEFNAEKQPCSSVSQDWIVILGSRHLKITSANMTLQNTPAR